MERRLRKIVAGNGADGRAIASLFRKLRGTRVQVSDGAQAVVIGKLLDEKRDDAA